MTFGIIRTVLSIFIKRCQNPFNQWHDHCPDGEQSWCRYKRDKDTGESTYIPGAGLPLKIVLRHLKPMFANLSKEELLSRCLHGKTQNNNESFNGTAWDRLP